MSITPALWIHCANNSLALPQYRMLNPYLVQRGWVAFLERPRDIATRFNVTRSFLVLPLGDGVRKWDDGTLPTRLEMRQYSDILRRQDFNAYRRCVADSMIDTVMNMDALHEAVASMPGEVVCYMGPWLSGRLTPEAVRIALEWTYNGDREIRTIAVDGEGARAGEIADALKANQKFTVIEPMAQRRTHDDRAMDERMLAFDSVTLESSLEDMDGFFPLDRYTGTRYWVDNVNGFYPDPDAYFRLARDRIAQGFVPCLPPDEVLWAAWSQEMGGLGGGGEGGQNS